MEEWLARATRGVDPGAPGAFWHIFANLMGMLPWAALAWWNLVFVAVGAVLGWRRGRWAEGIAWALLLGPLGWIVVLRRKRPAIPPLLPPRRR